jgi:isoamylase
MKLQTKYGNHLCLGAHFDGSGVDFAIFSANAEKVELCLFNSIEESTPSATFFLNRTEDIFHLYLSEVKPGQLYGYRVYGKYDPLKGFRFNPNKILLDPYARELGREFIWDNSLFGYKIEDSKTVDDDLYLDLEGNNCFCPLARVVESSSGVIHKYPKTAWKDSIIYEAHVRGISINHPKVPQKLRGKFAGLASKPVIEHLLQLGVTAIELLPIQTSVSERNLANNGLKNYWGYNTLNFFTLDNKFYSGEFSSAREEFVFMVQQFHDVGIEVIIDVVYNHSPEGNHLGPTISYRGIDNASYYCLNAQEPRYYLDYTGCGNTVNVNHPRVAQLICDSLRYWTMEMGVDGFRFDLAPVLGRAGSEVDLQGGFYSIIQQDPILSKCKLLAEPWDLGPNGYQLGNFSPCWREWNGKYRDGVRSFWRGDKRAQGTLATRITGSSDLFAKNNRGPTASINFVTCHDGFTLHDLVSYNSKHNLQNLEENRDGNNDNKSWNCGVEGETEDSQIQRLRLRQKKNLLATLFLSAGVPMLLGGDELGRTQGGNNNAYCQDNEVSWFNWEHIETELLNFVIELINLRKSLPVISRSQFYKGEIIKETKKDLLWLRKDCQEMTEADWVDTDLCELGVLITQGLEESLEEGMLLLLFNSGKQPINFTLPKGEKHKNPCWELIFDTSTEGANTFKSPREVISSVSYELRELSLVFLRGVTV